VQQHWLWNAKKLAVNWLMMLDLLKPSVVRMVGKNAEIDTRALFAPNRSHLRRRSKEWASKVVVGSSDYDIYPPILESGYNLSFIHGGTDVATAVGLGYDYPLERASIAMERNEPASSSSDVGATVNKAHIIAAFKDWR